MKFKSKQKEAKALIDNLYEYIDEVATDKAKLLQELKELRFQNENLILEVKRQKKINDRQFEAAVLIAKKAESLKEENLKLKIRLDVLSKKGACKDDVQK